MAGSNRTMVEMRELIEQICHSELLYLVEPSQEEAATQAPSSSKENYLVQMEIDEEVIVKLKTGIFSMFDHMYNNTALESILTTIIFSISDPLIAFRSAPKECSVKDGLLLPVLTTIFKYAPLKPNLASCDGFDIHVVPEDKIVLKGGRGRKPEVDFVISIEHMGIILKMIPVEAKISLQINDLKQMAAYCNKIGTCDHFAAEMIVGILIDSKNYQLAFAPYMDGSKKSVPLVCISPPMAKCGCSSTFGELCCDNAIESTSPDANSEDLNQPDHNICTTNRTGIV